MFIDIEVWLLVYFRLALDCNANVLDALSHWLDRNQTICNRFCRAIDRFRKLGYKRQGTSGNPSLESVWNTPQGFKIVVWKYRKVVTVTARGRYCEVLRLTWARNMFKIKSPLRTTTGEPPPDIICPRFRAWLRTFTQLLAKLERVNESV
jgi:hypothetical protein